MLEPFRPEGLVIGSGGFRGYMFIGALHRLYSENVLEDVRVYAGSSVGSILIFLLAIGYTPREIWKITADLNLKYFIKLSENMLRNVGISTMEKVCEFLQDLATKKGFSNPTFADIYKEEGKELYIVANNITKKRESIFSYEHTPNMKVIWAIAMSCSIPLVFVPFRLDNQEYNDGGLCNPYPINYIDRDINILGLYLDDIAKDEGKDRFNLIVTGNLDTMRNKLIEQSSNKCKHIALYPTTLDLTGTSLTHEERTAMVIVGDTLVNVWLRGRERTGRDSSRHDYLTHSTLDKNYLEESDHSGEDKDDRDGVYEDPIDLEEVTYDTGLLL